MGHVACCRPLDDIEWPEFLKIFMGSFSSIAGDGPNGVVA